MFYIYKIQSIINNKIYIGVTNNPNVRRTSHFTLLKNNKHYNMLLQNHYNKYGKETHASKVFIFEVIETCNTVELAFNQEQYWIKNYQTCDRSKGFNLTDGGEMNCWTPEHIAKRKETVRNSSKPIFIYDINGQLIKQCRSVIDACEEFQLNRNAVSNALHRGIRYKGYMFFRTEQKFELYVPKQSGIIVYIEVYSEDHILLDVVKGLKQCAEKYGLNINSLNSRCRRNTIINKVYFKKVYSKSNHQLESYL